MITCLTLPMPPSVNRMNGNRRGRGRGRYTCQKVADWRMQARHVLRQQSPQRVGGPVLIVVNMERHSKFADVDNRVKALFDFLVKEDVIDDDRNLTGFAVAWSPQASSSIHVGITPVSELFLKFQPSEKNGALGGWIMQAPQPEEKEAA